MAVNERIAAAFAYVFGWISGLLAYAVRSDSRFVRFHALQSIILSLAGGFFAIVFMVVLWIGGILASYVIDSWGVIVIAAGLLILVLASVGLSGLLAYKAYTGVVYRLPVIGSIADRHA